MRRTADLVSAVNLVRSNFNHEYFFVIFRPSEVYIRVAHIAFHAMLQEMSYSLLG